MRSASYQTISWPQGKQPGLLFDTVMVICQGYSVPNLSRQFCEYQRNNQSLLSYLRLSLHYLQQIKGSLSWKPEYGYKGGGRYDATKSAWFDYINPIAR